MQRMRTITQAYEYLRSQDPQTAITKTAFREFVNKGYIPVVVVGKTKKLINLDNVDRFLEEGMQSKEREECVSGRVRRLRA